MTDEAIHDLLLRVEAKDRSTAAHTWRVVLYARAVAEAGGAPHERVELFGRAAAVHDVGKLVVPDAILQKPGRLTNEEFAVIKTHAAEGERILRELGERDPLVLGLVRHHHERLDGSGYPDGLRGDEIPLAARYFTVIDAFDAMTSVRPYRHDVGPQAAERALEELWNKAGAWYCPSALSLFDRVYHSGLVAWVLEYFNDDRPLPPPPLNSGAGLRPGAATHWPRVVTPARPGVRADR
ncbi:MAG: HD-GYP domain-containing protein [Phycisphaeraceae bacterium]|nr:HD-GYP domain-containing protein [Phycisphaeraceae bacterium]